MTSILEYQKRKENLDHRILQKRAKLAEKAIKTLDEKKNKEHIAASARTIRRLKNELQILIETSQQLHKRVDKCLRNIEKEYWL